ncbi:hypothetical protein K523DRAFT_325156 [Schizophyllum commune Tattone D]|nr:hypothetical protein K523DRAFT_325156 [Schizophyllum commune Tattone D]
MGGLSADDLEILEALIEENGRDALQRYIDDTFSPTLIKVKRMTTENAAEWIDIANFTDWIVAVCQGQLRPAPDTPRATPFRSITNQLSSTPVGAFRTPTKPVYRAPSSPLPPSSPPGSSPCPPTYQLAHSSSSLAGPIEKRKRQLTAGSDEILIISPSASPRIKPKKKKAKKKKRQDYDDDEISVVDVVKITRQKAVRKIITLDTPPPYFDIPRENNDFVYLLDLSGSSTDLQYQDTKGEEHGMAWIITNFNHDAFTSKHSKSKLVDVAALGVMCKFVELACSGVYICDQFDNAQLAGYERFEVDEEEMKMLFDQEREASEHAGQSFASRAATFYNDAMRSKCKGDCTGVPVYRTFKSMQMNFDGKMGFIGCSGWKIGDSRGDHRFLTIPRQFCERIIRLLFQTGGVLDPADLTDADILSCARIQAPRNGGKGAKLCPYPHFNGPEVVQGQMVHRKCPAKGTIYIPADATDRRAIISFHNVPHNHPPPTRAKLTPLGKDLYNQAIDQVADKTMLRVDMGTDLEYFW